MRNKRGIADDTTDDSLLIKVNFKFSVEICFVFEYRNGGIELIKLTPNTREAIVR